MKFIFVIIGMASLSILNICTYAQPNEKVQKWNADIDFIVSHIESIHPDPWHRLPRGVFLDKTNKLKAELASISEEAIIVRAMQLVASLSDGHTTLTPYNHILIPIWFPIRVDKFDDGIFITAAAKKYQELVGAKVLRIGNYEAEQCFRLVGSVTSVDNPRGFQRTVPVYISNATILKGLGIIENKESLRLEVSLLDGKTVNTTLPSIRWPFDMGWVRNRNIAPGNDESVTVFSNRMNRLPLHLKKMLTTKEKYWFEFIPEHRAIYFQFNSVSNDKEPFVEFVKRLWAAYETNSQSIDKFIVDLRYNEGGDGTLLLPLLHQFIKHEEIIQRGKLYAIIGANTFSAASNFLGQMIKHTNAITVGEPASGPLNWFSDIERLLTPSGRLGIDISTMYWQEGHPLDDRGYCPPEYPVLVTAKDYFSGKDRALEEILNGRAAPLSDIMMKRGAEAFLVEYKKWSDKFTDYEWWFPYTVFDLRIMGVELFVKGKKKDAISIFEFITARHPDVSWVWEILGNLYEDVGDRNEAVRCLRRALELSPNDVYIKGALNSLTK